MRPNIQCDAPTCWCNEPDYVERWIPSIDGYQGLDELSRQGNARVFRFRVIERGIQHEQA